MATLQNTTDISFVFLSLHFLLMLSLSLSLGLFQSLRYSLEQWLMAHWWIHSGFVMERCGNRSELPPMFSLSMRDMNELKKIPLHLFKLLRSSRYGLARSFIYIFVVHATISAQCCAHQLHQFYQLSESACGCTDDISKSFWV